MFLQSLVKDILDEDKEIEQMNKKAEVINSIQADTLKANLKPVSFFIYIPPYCNEKKTSQVWEYTDRE